MEKLDIYLANIRSRVAFFSIVSGHNFLNALSVTMITKKSSSLENVDCQGNKTCRKVQKVFRSRRKTNLHCIEKDELCICWTYDTILKKEFRFMEDYGYVFVHKLTQFLTTLKLWKEFLFRFDTRKCHELDFWSFWYSLPLTSQKTQG